MLLSSFVVQANDNANAKETEAGSGDMESESLETHGHETNDNRNLESGNGQELEDSGDGPVNSDGMDFGRKLVRKENRVHKVRTLVGSVKLVH